MKLCKYENSRNFVHVFCSCIIERLLNWHHAGTRYQALCTKQQTAVAFNIITVFVMLHRLAKGEIVVVFFRLMSNCFHANVVIVHSTSFQMDYFVALF